MATNAMADLLHLRLGIELSDAVMLMSAVGQLRVSQMVDPLRTARFEMPKSAYEASYGRLICKLEDGSLIEGVVDLAFRDDTPDFSGWTVVDFKTDREFAMASDRYKAQVATYAGAIQTATGMRFAGYFAGDLIVGSASLSVTAATTNS